MMSYYFLSDGAASAAPFLVNVVDLATPGTPGGNVPSNIHFGTHATNFHPVRDGTWRFS
jgi:hypothetical protein